MERAHDEAGPRLRWYRTQRNMSLETAAYELRDILPRDLTITKAQLARVEMGESPLRAHIAAALSVIYRVPVAELAPGLDADVRVMADLFARSCAPWDSNPEPAGSALALAAA